VSRYRIVWSLEKAMMGRTGNMNSELDEANALEVNRGVYQSTRYAQAERDPYIYESNELGFAVKRPRRRGAA
jgi:hypothetical protein